MRGLLSPLIKLVVFLLVTIFFTYALAATIANKSFGSTVGYKAEFTDVSGLQIGDDVRIAGVRVGTVSGIKLVHAKTGDTANYAVVSFTVVKSRSLPTSTTATMRYRNLVGQRYINIEQGAGDANSVIPKGGTIDLNHTAPALDLTVLFAGFKPLFQGLSADQINGLSTEIISTLQGEGGSLELLLSNLADLTNSLADKDQVIGSVVDNLASVLTTVGQRDTELSDLIANLQSFISGLAADRTTIGNAIEGINGLATSTANLLSNVRAPLAQDISDLSALTGNLVRNSPTLQYLLDHMPTTTARLVRTGSYGSWFNFYLCRTQGVITLPGNAKINIPLQTTNAARCK